VVKFWYALNDAAIAAVENPGLVTEVGLIKFKHTGGFLYCRLPNGRKIAYREPIIKEEPTRFGVKKQVSFMGTNSKTKKWERQRTYGGKLAENIVQATARDFMADGMLRVEKKGYYIVMTVHDEIICEVPEEFGSVEEFEKLMATVPTWGKGCPIGVEGWRGKRFKK
jgi:DNA polymerase